MRFILMLSILAFPVAEIWILISLADQYGWWLALYLLAMIVLGIRLIREEKAMLSARMMQGLMQGGHPMKAVFGSARNMIAGVLLIIPGVLTDVLAALLLLIPINSPKSQAYQAERAANDDVIEGEFRRED